MNEDEFKSRFVATFCATWCAKNYEAQKPMEPPMEDAMRLADRAWESWLQVRAERRARRNDAKRFAPIRPLEFKFC